MITHLRDRVLDLYYSVLSLFPPRHSRYQEPLPVVRGNMRRVLVLKPPGPIFQEAVFILRDDYFQTPGLSRKALMREARAAAESYLAENAPSAPRTPSVALPSFLLGAACAVLALWLAGLLAPV